MKSSFKLVQEAQRKILRRQTATHMLSGMLASTGIVDRTRVDADKWAKKAYEFADALIKRGNRK